MDDTETKTDKAESGIKEITGYSHRPSTTPFDGSIDLQD